MQNCLQEQKRFYAHVYSLCKITYRNREDFLRKLAFCAKLLLKTEKNSYAKLLSAQTYLLENELFTSDENAFSEHLL